MEEFLIALGVPETAVGEQPPAEDFVRSAYVTALWLGFVIIAAGIAFRFFLARGFNSLQALVLPIILVILIIVYPLTGERVAFLIDELAREVSISVLADPTDPTLTRDDLTGDHTIEFYSFINGEIANARNLGDPEWGFLLENTGVGVLSAIRDFAYETISTINVFIIQGAKILQELLQGLFSLFVPVAVALFMFGATRGKAISFLLLTLEVLLWPLGWAFGELVSRAIITQPFGAALPSPQIITGLSIVLLVWTLFYIVGTVVLFHSLLSAGLGNSQKLQDFSDGLDPGQQPFVDTEPSLAESSYEPNVEVVVESSSPAQTQSRIVV